jgi:alpha-ketoglutarate-dependent taurine dioxygenase
LLAWQHSACWWRQADTTKIVGINPWKLALVELGNQDDLSEEMLDALWAHATQPRFVMCHEWQVGDLLLWNNLSVLHRREPFDPNMRRIMHRTQIKGHEPIIV